MAEFLAALPSDHSLRILDVGGTPEFWQGTPISPDRITILNVEPQSSVGGHQIVRGDARDLSAYPDQSFPIVHSNSVIGQVGTFADRQRMAAEIRRVARWFWVQTPDFWCPIDWRTLMPGFHWLPPHVQATAFRWVPVGRYRRATSLAEAEDWAHRIHDLTAGELRHLFPGAVILHERIAGVPKSLIAYGTSR